MQMDSRPRHSWRVALLAAPLVLASLALDAPACPCDVLLNEILAAPGRDWNGDGSVSSRDDEWVEILNTGGTAIDLSGYLLSDADSTLRYGFSGVLGAGERRLVFGLEAVDWQKANGRAVTGLSLNNSGDTVRLFRAMGTDTLLVDAYGYKSHEGGMDRASGRRPDGGEVWALFDGLDPYTGGLDPGATGCLPTPGQANACPATESQESTWGWLKGAYR
jgi:hypothetical protein